jgi:hypothetical protein
LREKSFSLFFLDSNGKNKKQLNDGTLGHLAPPSSYFLSKKLLPPEKKRRKKKHTRRSGNVRWGTFGPACKRIRKTRIREITL